MDRWEVERSADWNTTKRLCAEGWEPFGVSPEERYYEARYCYVLLKRRIIESSDVEGEKE